MRAPKFSACRQIYVISEISFLDDRDEVHPCLLEKVWLFSTSETRSKLPIPYLL